jgi:hypothetical protein
MCENVEVRMHVEVRYCGFYPFFGSGSTLHSYFFGTIYESTFHIPNADSVPEVTNADPVPEGRKSAKRRRTNTTLDHGSGSGSVSAFRM